MTASEYPSLGLAEAILKTIADHTGREVRGAEVYALGRDYISVTAALEEDGTILVEFGDPMAPTVPGAQK